MQDPDEYYDPPGGLVSFDLHVDEFLEPASHLDLKGSTLGDFKPHFDLVHNQLSQVGPPPELPAQLLSVPLLVDQDCR